MNVEKTTFGKFKNKYYKGRNPVAVYNRNKNNYKSNQVKKYNTIQSKKRNNGVNTKSMNEYQRRKKLNDGSHLHVKGNMNSKGKSGK